MVGVLIRMKLAVLRHTMRGRQAVLVILGALFGLLFAAFTVLAGAVPYPNPDVAVDIVAALLAVWLVGWLLGPILTGGGDETLRAEHFTLLPIRPRRLAFGLLVASFVGAPTIVTMLAFAGLVVYGGTLGGVPALIGVVFAVLLVVLVVLASRTALAGIGALLSSRKGRDLGILLAALLGLSGVAVNYALNSLGPALIEQRADGLSTVLRVLPSGWGPLAVRAAADGAWGTVALLLLATVVLLGVLLWLYAVLLVRRTTVAAYTGGAGRAVSAKRITTGGVLPATPTGAVVGKELRTWWRDARRRVALLSSVIVGLVIAVVPSLSAGSDGGSHTGTLPYLALWLGAFACLQSGNLYGFDGSALWHTLVTPNAYRSDVRGRQFAWLLLVGPAVLVLAAVMPAVAGAPGAYPWVLALAAVVIGGGSGLVVVLSVYVGYPVPDQRKNSNPFASGGRPGLARVLMQLGITLLLAVAALPTIAVLVAGAVTGLPVLTWLALPVGLLSGVFLAWWWGRLSYQRLAARGPEVFSLVRKEK